MNEPSLLDDSPAVVFMSDMLAQPQFSEGYKRNFTLASENVNTGEYHLFTRDNVAFGDDLA